MPMLTIKDGRHFVGFWFFWLPKFEADVLAGVWLNDDDRTKHTIRYRFRYHDRQDANGNDIKNEWGGSGTVESDLLTLFNGVDEHMRTIAKAAGADMAEHFRSTFVDSDDGEEVMELYRATVGDAFKIVGYIPAGKPQEVN